MYAFGQHQTHDVYTVHRTTTPSPFEFNSIFDPTHRFKLHATMQSITANPPSRWPNSRIAVTGINASLSITKCEFERPLPMVEKGGTNVEGPLTNAS